MPLFHHKKTSTPKVFGEPLKRDSFIPPHVLTHFLSLIEQEGGLRQEGIFRISGNKLTMDALQAALDRGVTPVTLTHSTAHTVHDLAGVVKRFFRELPDPLFTFEYYCCFLAAAQMNPPHCFNVIAHTICLLPLGHRIVLQFLVEFCAKLCSLSNVNKMNSRNIALVFVPNLLRSETETIEDAIVDSPFQIRLFTYLIENQEWIFKLVALELEEKSKKDKEKQLDSKKKEEGQEVKETKDSKGKDTQYLF